RTAHVVLCRASSLLLCIVCRHGTHPTLPSFPTRRSSDLSKSFIAEVMPPFPLYESLLDEAGRAAIGSIHNAYRGTAIDLCQEGLDRKSTRLNSSHVSISYAVFCLKKKMQHSKLRIVMQLM